jgi:hypothetical protein
VRRLGLKVKANEVGKPDQDNGYRAKAELTIISLPQREPGLEKE